MKQLVISPEGERMILLPEAEYEALIEAVEDATDLIEARRILDRIESGEGYTLTAAQLHRLLDGDSPVRVFRELRGMSAKELAEKAGIAQAFLSQIESRKREGSVATLKKLAAALSVTVDDLLAGPAEE